MTYAMILKNRVIGILPEQDKEPHWPPDLEGNHIEAFPCGDDVELGMEYDVETGAYFWPEYTPPEEPITPEPTQMDRIESMLTILTADTVTAESINTAISEGVNEV